MKKSITTGSSLPTFSEVSRLYAPTERNISDEANICLNCDLPECVEDNSDKMCSRLKSELKKLHNGKRKNYITVKK